MHSFRYYNSLSRIYKFFFKKYTSINIYKLLKSIIVMKTKVKLIYIYEIYCDF